MDNVVEFCIYKRDDKSSYIDRCNVPFSTNTTLVSQFYAIDPNVRPIPPGLQLLCFKSNTNPTKEENIVQSIYDPFDIDENKNCTKLITWMEPAPYTTPLYIGQYGSNGYIGFETVTAPFKELYFSPIYVLTDPRLGKKQIDAHTDFSISKDYPVFNFIEYQGRCVPNPNGTTLSQCIKKIKTQPTLLDMLRVNEKTLQHNFWIYTLVILVIIILVVLLVKSKMKNSYEL
jgi:hypothetical protein